MSGTKQTLFEWFTREQDNPERIPKSQNEHLWPIQVMQHTLALFTHLPLRLWDPGWKNEDDPSAVPERWADLFKDKTCAGLSEEGKRKAVDAADAFFSEQVEIDDVSRFQDYRKPPNNERALHQTPGVHDVCPDGAHKCWVRHHTDRRTNKWLTLHCNKLPVHDYLRESRSWIAWENVAFEKWLGGCFKYASPVKGRPFQCEKARRQDKLVLSDFAVKGMQVAAYPLSVRRPDGEPLILVIGPMIVKPQRKETKFHWFKTTVDNLVEVLAAAMGRVATRSEFPLEKDTLRLRAGARGFIGERCFERQACLAGRIFDALLGAGCTFDSDTVIRHYSYPAAARAALMLYRSVLEDTLWDRACGVGTRVVVPLDRREEVRIRPVDQPEKEKRSRKLTMTADRSDEGWVLRLDMTRSENDPPGKGQHPTEPITVRPLFSPHKKGLKLAGQIGNCLGFSPYRLSAEDLEEHLNRIWQEMGLTNVTLNNVYISDRLAKLSAWINREFDRIPHHNADDPADAILIRLCNRILELLSADTVTIFRVMHDTGRLEPIRLFFQEKYGQHLRKFWHRVETHLMNRLAGNRTDLDRSISYRALLKRKGFLSRMAAVPASESPNDEDQRMANPEEVDYRKAVDDFKDALLTEKGSDPVFCARHKARSGLAVPLVVHGKMFGILEACGFDYHQFRLDSLVLAERVAEIVGPFLYQRDTLRRLYRLSAVAMDPYRTEQEKYTEICAETARIFLAEAAMLLVPSADAWSTYDMVAQYNLKRWDPEVVLPRRIEAEDLGYEEDEPGYVESDENHSVAPFTEYLVSEQIKVVAKVEGKNTGKKWHEDDRMPHRAAIAQQFSPHHSDEKPADGRIDGLAVIIRVRNRRNGMILCRLSLYYPVFGEDDKSLNREWNATIRFVSHYLVSLLMTMRALRPLTRLLEEADVFKKIDHAVQTGEEPPGKDFGPKLLTSLTKMFDRKLLPAPEDTETCPKKIETSTQREVKHREKLKGQRERLAKKIAVNSKTYPLMVVLGAGVSIPYGGPDWGTLIQRLLTYCFSDYRRTKASDTSVASSAAAPQDHAFTWLKDYVPAVFQGLFEQKSPILTATYIRQWLNSQDRGNTSTGQTAGTAEATTDEASEAFLEALRQAIYEKLEFDALKPSPESGCHHDLLDLFDICRAGERSLFDGIITLNYDDLIGIIAESEKRSTSVQRIFDKDGAAYLWTGPISKRREEAPKKRLSVYHIHGFLRKKDGPDKDHSDQDEGNRPVLAEEAYHELYTKPYEWQNVISLRAFQKNTCLFIGLSFDDPNLRRLLDVAVRSDPIRNPDTRHVALIPDIRKEDSLKIRYTVEAILLRPQYKKEPDKQNSPEGPNTGTERGFSSLDLDMSHDGYKHFNRQVDDIVEKLIDFLRRKEDEMYAKLGVQVYRFQEYTEIPQFIRDIQHQIEKGSQSRK